MAMLSEDDLDLSTLTPAELDAAWDLWFDLAQETNDLDPPYTHGVFQLCAPGTEPVGVPTGKGGSMAASGTKPSAG